MRVYHFINEKYGLESLRLKRLKVATFEDSNDPFEFNAFVADEHISRQALAKIKANGTARSGMLCFSRDWSNSVQWSHYADGHRGLALGFDVPDEALIAIEYRATRIKPDWDRLDPAHESAISEIIRLFSTKYIHWKYEREMRLLVPRKPDYAHFVDGRLIEFEPYSDELRLAEVIIGHSSSVTRTNVNDALGDLAALVEVKKARLAFRSYKVVLQRDRTVW